MKTEITRTELLKIHGIACDSWKSIIRTEFFPRVNLLKDTIEFEESEIEAMFNASNASQYLELENIFGKRCEKIDFDKLKVGSEVMLRYTGQIINYKGIDFTKPFKLILKDSKYILARDYQTEEIKFDKGAYEKQYSFFQGNNVCCFSSTNNTDFIVSVISY